jgi:hypothetical protein
MTAAVGSVKERDVVSLPFLPCAALFFMEVVFGLHFSVSG